MREKVSAMIECEYSSDEDLSVVANVIIKAWLTRKEMISNGHKGRRNLLA